MTRIEGIPPRQPDDLSYEGALALAAKDYGRLAHVHQLWWQVSKDGSIFIGCSCDERRRSPSAMAVHLKDAIKRERGPKPIEKRY